MPKRGKEAEVEQVRLSKTSLNLPSELWKKFRILALQEERTAQEIVVELLEDYIRRPKKKGGP